MQSVSKRLSWNGLLSARGGGERGADASSGYGEGCGGE